MLNIIPILYPTGIHNYELEKQKTMAKSKIELISARAKKIYKGSTKEKWTDAIKRASNELKKEGKI